MKIMEMAQVIGIAIKASPEGQRFEKAKKEYSECKEIQNALTEYELQSQMLQNQKVTKNFDPQLLENINNRLDALYDYLTSHELFKEYEQAQEELNALIKSVNATILAQVTGELPSDCTHDCSTCGGCSQ